MAVDGWAVTFGTARRGLGRAGPQVKILPSVSPIKFTIRHIATSPTGKQD